MSKCKTSLEVGGMGHSVKRKEDARFIRGQGNYVDDVVDALIRASNTSDAFGQVMNLGSDQIINLESLANRLIGLYPKSSWEKVPFPEFRKSIDIGDYYSNYKKSEKILSWEPKVGLEEGLKKTINFYEKNIEYYL